MRLFIEYLKYTKRLRIDTSEKASVKEIKSKAEAHFNIDITGSFKDVTHVLRYAGCDLNDDWLLKDVAIPTCSTLKYVVQPKNKPDFYAFVEFKNNEVKLCDTGLEPRVSTVLDLRVYISEFMGLPLSIFRLKSINGACFYDNYTLYDYDLFKPSRFVLETWKGWSSFLDNCIKGLTPKVIETLNDDESIKQFQLRVALYIASFYGNQELATTMITMGVRADKPVGEHPCRQWCQKSPYLKKISKLRDRYEQESLKCPIHVAIQNGQLKIIIQIFNLTNVYVLQRPDGFGTPPWRLALKNKHKLGSEKNLKQKDIARYLIGKTFERKIQISDAVKIAIPFYYKILEWVENARERVIRLYGSNKSSVNNKKYHLTNRSGLVGNKVLIDGFNNDFKDYKNSFERLRSNYKHYYFINDEEKERRTSNIDINYRPKKSKKSATTRRVKSLVIDIPDELNLKFNSWAEVADITNIMPLNSESKIAEKPKVCSNSYVKTSAERAKESFEIASRFTSKSWLQQIRIGSKIALNDFKKLSDPNDNIRTSKS